MAGPQAFHRGPRSQLIDLPRAGPRRLARARVEGQQLLDGTLRVLHEGRCLAATRARAMPGLSAWATSPVPSCLFQPTTAEPSRSLETRSQPRLARTAEADRVTKSLSH